MYWLAQTFGWLAYLMLIVLATYESRPERIDIYFIINLSFLYVCAIFFTHMMRIFFIRRNWLNKKFKGLLPRVIITSLICSILIGASLSIFGRTIEPKNEPFKILGFILDILSILVLVLSWNAIYFSYHFFRKSREKEIENISLEASRNEIELKNLRSQLNPHFLFNSLNSIRALVDLDPNKAKYAVTTLSKLLRNSLVMGKENLVELQTELDMISNYLDMEKIRFEERLTIEWQLDRSLDHFLIPPFSLQMLVENAIKHGIAHQISGGLIKIVTAKEDNRVVISVSNTGELQDKEDVGIGIENTKRRLDLQFKKNAKFELRQENNEVIAALIFFQ